MDVQPIAVTTDQCVEDSNIDYGTCRWQTLFGRDDHDAPMTLGYATFPSHGVLHLHHHDDAEFYYCTRGSGLVTIDDQLIELAPNMAVMIPGGSIHGVQAGPDGLEFLYGFANQPKFSNVNYQFLEIIGQTHEGPSAMPAEDCVAPQGTNI